MRLILEKIGRWSYFRLSEPVIGGFNYGFFSKRCPNLTLETEAKDFLEKFGLNRFVSMKQEHGERINVVKNGENPRVGDGIILLERKVASIIKTADCLPIILLDPEKRISGIVHAGYRGSLLRIARSAVEKMVELGSDPLSLIAIIGPGIRSCCYDIPYERAVLFEEEYKDSRIIERRDGKIYLDLAFANRITLERCGVKKIFDTGLCTFCNPELFYSYRRGEAEKRQINFVSII